MFVYVCICLYASCSCTYNTIHLKTVGQRDCSIMLRVVSPVQCSTYEVYILAFHSQFDTMQSIPIWQPVSQPENHLKYACG